MKTLPVYICLKETERFLFCYLFENYTARAEVFKEKIDDVLLRVLSHNSINNWSLVMGVTEQRRIHELPNDDPYPDHVNRPDYKKITVIRGIKLQEKIEFIRNLRNVDLCEVMAQAYKECDPTSLYALEAAHLRGLVGGFICIDRADIWYDRV